MADQDDELELNDVDSGAEDSDSPAAPAGSTSAMNPVLKQYLQNKQQLASAQSRANTNEMLTGLARANASLSAGLAHANQPVNDAPFTAMASADKQPVTDVLEAQKSAGTDLANQQAAMTTVKQTADSDPNSPQSKAKQNMIKSLYPGKFSDDELETMSAADIGESILKPLELDEKIKEHADEMKSRQADRAAAKEDRASTKATADQSKALNYVTTQLESARGDGAIKQAQVDLYSTKKINSLVNLYPDPNNLSQRQVQLLADEVAKVATGGIPGEAGTEAITPHTLTGRMSTFVSNLLNKPTAANAAEFIKQYKEYSDAIAKDASSTIKSKLDAVIETHRKQMGEDNYQTVKKQYYNRYGLGDDSAIDTGADNGDHASRAAAILAQRQSAKASQDTINQAMPNFNSPQPGSNSTGVPSSLAAPGFAYGGTVHAPGFQHMNAVPKMPAVRAPHLPAAPREVMPVGDKSMVHPAHFERGGTVPGQPNVPFNSPVNDTVSAKLTPKEEVLPLSVTQSKSPAIAAYLHMKSRGYK